jgi:hypothetical protein
MSQISESIWNQDEKGDWKLFFNNESNISSNLSNKEEKNSKNNNKINITSDTNLIIGKLVMTSKGIGRLIKTIEEIAYVRFGQDIEEHKFPVNEISNSFYCYVINLKKSLNKEIIRLKLNSEGNVKDIIEELIKINIINKDSNNFTLIFNKKRIKEENTFEQINLLNNSKIIFIDANNVEYKIYRFSGAQKYGLLSPQDGICFSVSENIKLTGVGLHYSHQNKKINGYIQIVDGPSVVNKVLYEQNIEIPASSSDTNIIYKVSFQKHFFCHKNTDYSLMLITNNVADMYSGIGGIKTIQGEKGIIFTFKNVNRNIGESNYSFGNFPEIYYYLN